MASVVQNKVGYFPALTGLRAIAAFMVFIHHYRPFEKLTVNQNLLAFFNELHVGVSLFFVLSGFLIAYRYLDLNKVNFRSYLVKRFAKIVPVYFLLVTATFIVYGLKNSQITGGKMLLIYFFNITFLKGFFEDLVYTGISQGWSLSVEECFYVLAPLIFVLIRKSKHYLYLLPLLILISGFVLVDLLKGQGTFGFMRNTDFMLLFTFFGRCSEFFVGIALALVIQSGLIRKQTRFCTYLGLSLIILSIYVISSLKGNNVTGLFHPLGLLTNHLLMPVFGTGLFFYGLIKETTVVSRILSGKLFQALGKSSYVFYLIHMGIFSDLIGTFTSSALIAFVLLNALAYLIYKCVEEPLGKGIRKRFKLSL